MSLPRRTPPSQMIVTLVAELVSHGLDQIDRCRGVIELAAAVVGQSETSNAHRDRLLGVGDGLDPLQHDRPVPDRTEPVDVVPRERLVEMPRPCAGEITAELPSSSLRPTTLANLIGSLRRKSSVHPGWIAPSTGCPARSSAAASSLDAHLVLAARARPCRRSATRPCNRPAFARSTSSFTSPRSRHV